MKLTLKASQWRQAVLARPKAHEFLHRVSSGTLAKVCSVWLADGRLGRFHNSWRKANCSRLRKTTVAVSTTFVHAKRSLWAAQMA